MVFPKNVKRDQQVFLQHVQLQTGIKGLPRVMKILLRAPVKFSRAFLNHHNGIDPFDIVIRKPLPGPALILPHLGILPHEQVAGIAGAAGAGKQVAHPLDLHVHQCPGQKPHQNIHHQQGPALGQPPGFIGNHLEYLHLLPKAETDELLQPLRLRSGIKDKLKHGIIGDPHPVHPHTEV